MEPFHADVLDFLEIRKNQGSEEERCRDLFTALWVPDIFMRRVEKDEMWSLMCPDECQGLTEVYGEDFDKLYTKYESEGKFKQQLKARELWRKVIESQCETGTPYILFKDAINIKNNQKNLGVIKSSNLCVASDTMLYTDKGYYTIKSLEDQTVKVWNGTKFSETIIKKTGENEKLLTVYFNNGMELNCTPYHKFYIKTSSGEKIIDARDLQKNMKIIDYKLPILNNLPKLNNAYTQGLFRAIGINNNGELVINLSKKKQRLLSKIDYEYSYKVLTNDIRVILDKNITIDIIVPINYDIDSKLRWLEGYLDGKNDVIKSTNYHFIKLMYYMFQTLGIKTIISKKSHKSYNEYKLLIDDCDKLLLKNIGLNNEIICNNFYGNKANNPVEIVKVEETPYVEDTYCFTEPLEHKGIFNGVITGQCSEITLYTNYKSEIAVCNLASICLPKYINKDGTYNYDKLHYVAKILTKNINKVIDRNYYPLKKAKDSNLLHRPCGIGVQGLADTYAIMKYAYDSDEAKKLNISIFETIYHGALEASMEIAQKRKEWYNKSVNNKEYMDKWTNDPELQKSEYPEQNLLKLNLIEEEKLLPDEYIGAYSSFVGSPISKGIFQFELWGKKPATDRYDWESLRKAILENGVRNSMLLALMPTASTSQICGFNESFEAFNSIMYKRSTLAGEFVVINKYLMEDLISQGLWNNDLKEKVILNNGSIQNIMEIPSDLRKIYKTVWEIPQKVIIDQSIERAPFICQAQSLNLFFEEPRYDKLTSALFHAWRNGHKNGCYYVRSKPKAKIQSFTIDPNKSKEIKNDIKDEEEICLSCGA